jgi:hypothetical protein
MFKTSTPYIVYLILSILVVIFSNYVNLAVNFVVYLYDYIDDLLDILFSNSKAGILSRSSFALVVCPLLITGIPAIIYYAIKKVKMPYFVEATWLIWMIVVLGNTIIK